MLIMEKAGTVDTITIGNRVVDKLVIEWFEANKRIMHKQTQLGKAVALKFLQQNPALKDGDVLWLEENFIIVIEIRQCEAIVIEPKTMQEAANVCYEIGNKHLPLFFEDDELLVPFEAPLYKLLQGLGYPIKIEKRKLTNPVRTTVSPHAHPGNNTGLFSKILQLTTS